MLLSRSELGFLSLSEEINILAHCWVALEFHTSEARSRLASDRSLKVCYDGTLANLKRASGLSFSSQYLSTEQEERQHPKTG